MNSDPTLGSSALQTIPTEDATTVDDFLIECLPDIDAGLARANTPLHSRTLKAAAFIAEHCVLEIEGGSKDNFLRQPWFAGLFQAVSRWYLGRYGDALSTERQRFTVAVGLIYGTPFQVAVPLTIVEPAQSDGTFEVCYPREVLPHEDPFAWITHPPTFGKADSSESEHVASTLIQTATHLRVCHVDQLTAHHSTENSRVLAKDVVPQLEKGAGDIARAERGSLSSAMWELNFAAEKSIKAFLVQQGIPYAPIHDVHKLHEIAVTHTGIDEVSATILHFPTGKDAVKHRYSALPTPQVSDVFSLYLAALSIASHYSTRLTRNFSFGNAVFRLKRPPWME